MSTAPIAAPTSPALSLHAASCIGSIPAVMSGMSSTARSPLGLLSTSPPPSATRRSRTRIWSMLSPRSASASTAPRSARTVRRSGGSPRRSTASRNASAGPGNSGRTLYRAADSALPALTSEPAGRDIRRLQFAGLAFRHHHPPFEDADTLAALVESPRLDGDDPAIGLARRLAFVEDCRLGIDRVAVKRRVLVLERFDLEVGYCLAADVGDAHPERQAVDEIAHDDVASELRLGLRVMRVRVERMVIHRQQAEEVIVGLCDRLARPVPVRGSDVEFLVVAAELHGQAAEVFADASSAARTSATGAWSPAALLMCL